jgi:hypothetical protein
MPFFTVRFTEQRTQEITIEADNPDAAKLAIMQMNYNPDDANQISISSVDIESVTEE